MYPISLQPRLGQALTLGFLYDSMLSIPPDVGPVGMFDTKSSGWMLTFSFEIMDVRTTGVITKLLMGVMGTSLSR